MLYICSVRNKQIEIMTTTELKNQELLEKLNPVIDIAKEMILAGVLPKNVVRHFTNRGWTLDAATNVMELGKFSADEFRK